VIHQTIEIPQTPAAAPAQPDAAKPDFFAYMQRLSPEEWKDHIIYLTRENPKTSINGLGGYLTKLQQPFDIEDIKNAYGGYEFSYIMKKKNDIAYSGRFRVEAAPKLDREREYNADSNRSQPIGTDGSVLRVLEQQNERLYQVLTELQGKDDKNPAINSAVDILTTAYKSGVQAINDTKPAAAAAVDPEKQLNGVLALAERIVAVRGEGGFNLEKILSNPIIAPLITRLISPPDPLAELAKLGGVLDALEKLRGNGGGGRRSDWRDTLASTVVESVPKVLETLKENREASVRIAEANRGTAADRKQAADTIERIRQNPPTAPAGTPGPVAVPPSPPPATTPLTTESIHGNGNATPAPAPAVAQTADVVADWIKARIVAGVENNEDPEAIVDFLDVADPAVCNQLVAFPAEVVEAWLRNDPILARAVNHANWPAFFEHARAYISDVPADPARPN